ncbi:unnamed protein product [Ectocarpus sp. CCAP 1310/34]|nr:unnamed protein product [Ectocarpus sp. CCAP 1310/34]
MEVKVLKRRLARFSCRVFMATRVLRRGPLPSPEFRGTHSTKAKDLLLLLGYRCPAV